MTTATRREQRERSLELLYEAEAKGVAVARVVDDLPVPPDAWVAELVIAVEEAAGALDEVIGRHAIGWAVDRMPVVDRTLLRIATFELLHRPEVPTGAAIAEAVELAKTFSTEESGRFVNGVLAAVAAEARPGS
ncbi:MAG TPA: transcription antitermination factor NusB [Acidimicrobiales bacterium]|nr:transcription antitermination factor NusB [Acidimicrobiales bacterium]